jgi:hypothetical protein
MARPESASPAATAEHAETAESVSDPRNAAHEPPLVVDLDGTLVATDLAIEAFLVLLRRSPIEALSLPFWLLHGRAAAKREATEPYGWCRLPRSRRRRASYLPRIRYGRAARA